MDRPTTRTDADEPGSRLGPHEAFVLPSRRPALDLCRDAIRAGSGKGAATGPVLVSGDSGVGKSWLWRRLEAEAFPSCRWIGVDLTPADDPDDFYRLIARELGLIEPGATGRAVSRVELIDHLAERQADGLRTALVVDEAQNVSPEIWEEVRVLANRLDRPGGFASMMLVGLTSLALRFSTRPFASIEARLASRVHLGPIDADEAADLLARLRPGREWPTDEVEALHRDAAGNPGRMLRRVVPTRAIGPTAEPPARMLATLEARPTVVDRPVPVASPAPLTGPDRPPIRVEENMIEVGWSPDEAPSPVGPDGGEPAQRVGPSAAIPGGEEAVRDHYAALQAWQEWSDNQARRAQQPPGSHVEGRDFDDEMEIEEDDEVDELPSPRPNRPTVRVEGEHQFAPFGQLFSRMAQPLEPE